MRIEDLVLDKEYLCDWGDGDTQGLVFKEMNIYEWRKCRAKFTTIDGLTTNFFNDEQVARLITEIKIKVTPVPHIHAKEMIAFANGYEIECYNDYDSEWCTVTNPIWHVKNKYRVKKDNSGKIALLEKVVAQLNEEIETRQVRKQGWLKCLQELQS